MRVIVLSLLMLFFSTILKAQVQVRASEIEMLNEDEIWSEGKIVLTDGTEINGLIKYNHREGFVAYNDGDNKKVFTPNSILRFGFYDERQKRHRQFLTLPSPDPKTGAERFMVFEIIREYEDFAILHRKDPMTARRRTTTRGYDYLVPDNKEWATNTRAEVSQVESILFLGTDGMIIPYIEVKHREDGMKSVLTMKDRKSKTKSVDEDRLAQYITEPTYEKLKAYASENDLKFKIIEDFLQILDYYDTIR